MVSSMTDTQIDSAFQAANAFVTKGSKDNPINLSNSDKLKFFALYKQATAGPCTGKQPSRMNIVARAKYDAWKSLGSISTKEAKLAYIKELQKAAPSFKAKL